jgi:hypothetical protein
MAVVYLALHKVASRLSKKPGSKLLWFFGVLTGPLTRPVKAWTMPGSNVDQILSKSLLFYAFLWFCMIALGRIADLLR